MGPIEPRDRPDDPFDQLNHRPEPARPPEQPALYVATDLSSWVAEEPRLFARDVWVDDKAYRLLDPIYYTWLRSCMTVAKGRFEAGGMMPGAYAELRRRFNTVHAWAMWVFGEDVLVQAGRTADLRGYVAPGVEHWRDGLGVDDGDRADDGMPGEHRLAQREDRTRDGVNRQVDRPAPPLVRSPRVSPASPERPAVQRSIFG